ncbi:SMI1/KNR4 family protein [Paenibacillus sp. JNUCC31]|uniref:SMI1/KNR4 family protein n=1 Tax=Paenibacillus sp. JNUCC-31 TaxID=2777983 RepID=UPI00178344BC|nr:SMI1/KNR4 family protein [Paenibacillus sp. JNUCC-31]QOS80377.1 SMI1/KNR4 family protein [Paenibacillus sp. JNUCC-31]
MEIQGSNEVLTESRLQDFERINGVQLPQQYREFLLKYNGGYPKPYYFTISKEQGIGMVNIFYGIGEMYDNLDKKVDIFDDILDAGFIPIADDSGGNQICLGLTEKHFGDVYFWIHDEDPEDLGNMYFLAKDFGGFLEKLHDEIEE